MHFKNKISSLLPTLKKFNNGLHFPYIFNKINMTKVIIIFTIGFITRILINNIYGINVFLEYLNTISLIYYSLISIFAVFVHEFVTYFNLNILSISSITSTIKYISSNISNIKISNIRLSSKNIMNSNKLTILGLEDENTRKMVNKPVSISDISHKNGDETLPNTRYNSNSKKGSSSSPSKPSRSNNSPSHIDNSSQRIKGSSSSRKYSSPPIMENKSRASLKSDFGYTKSGESAKSLRFVVDTINDNGNEIPYKTPIINQGDYRYGPSSSQEGVMPSRPRLSNLTTPSMSTISSTRTPYFPGYEGNASLACIQESAPLPKEINSNLANYRASSVYSSSYLKPAQPLMEDYYKPYSSNASPVNSNSVSPTSASPSGSNKISEVSRWSYTTNNEEENFLDKVKGKIKKVSKFVRDDLNETRRKAKIDLQKSLDLDGKSAVNIRNNKRTLNIKRLDRLNNYLDQYERARKKR